MARGNPIREETRRENSDDVNRNRAICAGIQSRRQAQRLTARKEEP